MVNETTDNRRFERHSTWCLTSITDSAGHAGSGHVVDLSWGGLGMRVDHLEQPLLWQGLVKRSSPMLKLGVLKQNWGVLRVIARVVRVSVSANRLILGVSLHWAEPRFFEFVRDIGRARLAP